MRSFSKPPAPSFADIMDVRKPWFTPPTIQLELVEGLKTYDVPAALVGFSGPIMVSGCRQGHCLSGGAGEVRGGQTQEAGAGGDLP